MTRKTAIAPARETVLAHFSIRHATFDQRAHAASVSGFDGFGLFVGAYVAAIRGGATDDALVDVLQSHGTRVIEIEALPMFNDEMLELVLAIGERFGARRIQTIAPFVGDVDRAQAALWLGAAADRAGAFGAALAIEFLPFTAIATASDAIELVERANRSNLGVCVDAWHVFRGAGLTSLQGLDAANVVSIQLNDGPLVPVIDDYVQDCLHHRDVMGEAEFDLATLMSMLPSNAPLSIEVPDDDLDLFEPDEVARRLMAATRLLTG